MICLIFGARKFGCIQKTGRPSFRCFHLRTSPSRLKTCRWSSKTSSQSGRTFGSSEGDVPRAGGLAVLGDVSMRTSFLHKQTRPLTHSCVGCGGCSVAVSNGSQTEVQLCAKQRMRRNYFRTSALLSFESRLGVSRFRSLG